jgi:hypothetical protein
MLDTSFGKWEKVYNIQQEPIFEYKTYAKNESEITRGIEAYRKPNGDIELRITAEDEWNDPISLPYTLSPELAAELGQKLLCIDEGFDGIVERAANEVRASTSTRR